MTPGDLAGLCQACGFCCDGSLFQLARLEPHEVEPARQLGLTVLPERAAFTQPCACLQGTSCTVYEQRPGTCRRFTCRLYERHRTEGGPLEPRLEVVARVRQLRALPDTPAHRAELGTLLEGHYARA